MLLNSFSCREDGRALADGFGQSAVYDRVRRRRSGVGVFRAPPRCCESVDQAVTVKVAVPDVPPHVVTVKVPAPAAAAAGTEVTIDVVLMGW
jgi:hypothetical protein